MKQLVMTAALAAAMAVPMVGNAQHAYPPNTVTRTNAVEGPTEFFEVVGSSTSREATVFNLPDLQGKKIYAIEVWGYVDADGKSWAANTTRNMYGYIGTGMPVENSKKGSASSYIANGKFYACFPDGVDVPEGDFTAGIWWDKGTNTPANCFLACVNGAGTANGIWAKRSPNDWADYSADHGPVPLKMWIGDEGLEPSFSIGVSKIENQKMDAGQALSLSVDFVDDGWCNNAQFTYVVKVDGQQVGEEVTIEKSTWRGGDLQPGVPYNATVTIPAFEADGTYNVSVDVLRVDDVDNESANASSSFTVQVGDGGEQPGQPADLVDISYNPDLNKLRRTGAVMDAGGFRMVAIALNDSIMELYQDYKAVGVRAYGFNPNDQSKYSGCKIFGYPGWEFVIVDDFTGFSVATVMDNATFVDVEMKDAALEGFFTEPISLASGNPLFGCTLSCTEAVSDPYAKSSMSEAPIGAFYYSNDGKYLFTYPGGGAAFITVLAQKEGATGVVELPVEIKELPACYYDLTGRKVTNPKHGVYIRVQNGKTQKVVK